MFGNGDLNLRLGGEAATGRFIENFAKAVTFAMAGDGHEQGIALVGRWEFQTDESAADALARLAIIEVAEAGIATDSLFEKVMEGTGALVEIKAEEGGIFQQISSKWDGAEGDIHRAGEILPGEATGF